MSTVSKPGSRQTLNNQLHFQLRLLGEDFAQILRRSHGPWASISFSGERHELTLEFVGTEAVEAGEAFIEALSEHEFSITGQLVADASVRSVYHQFGVTERMTVEIVLLLLAET